MVTLEQQVNTYLYYAAKEGFIDFEAEDWPWEQKLDYYNRGLAWEGYEPDSD